ncbi:MAG: glycosyltransferase [Bacteroidales bacterium]|nr:glycosyltransferase [Bacteroidales bacterium]
MASGENKKLNILILSNSNPYKIAGFVSLDILNGFRRIQGNKVKLIVRIWGNYKDKDIIPLQSFLGYKLNRIFRKIKNGFIRLKIIKDKIRNSNRDYSVQHYDQTKMLYSTNEILNKIDFVPDAIFYLFPQNFLTAKNLYELNKITKAPIYWQLCDMSAFTGLCHYAWDCEGYKNRCGNCPAIYSKNEVDISYSNLDFKKEYYSKTNLNVIVGSEWLINRAKQSYVLKDKKINKIYISSNEKMFYPIVDNTKLREKHKISSDTYVIGFGANGLKARGKGIQYILDAINLVKTERNILFIYAGGQVILKTFKHPTKYFGRLHRNELPDFYRLCNLWISASIQDIGPAMIVEALMCGLPVVSFDTGIANEFVKTNITGVLIADFNVNALANGINKMLKKSEEEINRIKINCYNITKENLSLEKQINDYYSLFREDGIITK